MARKPYITESLAILSEIKIPINSIIDVGVQRATPPLMKVFADKHHYLFEPVSDYEPAVINNYKNISHTFINAAVSDAPGSVHLRTQAKTKQDEITHSFIVEDDGDRIVPAITLDEFFLEIDDAPFLLKIDVEGAPVPAAILKGAHNVLDRCSVVVIEMTVSRFMERAAIIHAAGFDLWDITDLCYYADALWQFDAVFVRKDLYDTYPDLRRMGRGGFDAKLWQSGFQSGMQF